MYIHHIKGSFRPVLVLLLALAVTAIVAPIAVKFFGRPAFGLLSITPFVGFAWVLGKLLNGDFSSGKALTAHYGWMSSTHLDLTFRLDSLSALFSLIILGIGGLVLLYCWHYFDSVPRRLQPFAAQLSSFAMAMYGLVISDNMLLLYVFWEITSVLSFLLVGYYGERASSRHAAIQALMITTLGGLSMLVGIILLGRQTGIWELSGLANANLEGIHHISYALVLILAGALSKSAIAPTHFWLPGAMAAPTPVSAYLHSAAMVKAGIYLIARLAPDFAFSRVWYLVVISLGIFTMLLGGWISLRQTDLKLILAYGTVSQLGFITILIGIGSHAAMVAGLTLTFAHAMFKATLFMVVGAIDHTTGTRDIRKLSGLGRKQPVLMGIATLAAASMAGIPPLFGFVAKEAALEAVLHEHAIVGLPGQITLVGIVAGSILTMAYSLRFLFGAFATKDGIVSQPVLKMHRIELFLWLPPAILMVITALLGVFPQLLGTLLSAHTTSIFATQAHLALWHGFSLPLALSAAIVGIGAVMYWQRETVAKLHFAEPALGNASAAYDRVLDILRTSSLRLTASTQRGSLVINSGSIFAVFVLVPLIALLSGERNDVHMILWDTPLQAIVAGIMIVMAIGATVQSNRLSALIMVGMTGYGATIIFALHGAPDLALTQMLVETITVVVFMLVLRRLPARTQWQPSHRANRLRAWLAAAVGFTAVVLTVFAINARTEAPVSSVIPDLAQDIGHGANAVNVLLVDIRAWDTFGESTVLIIAAIGVSSLIYRTKSFQRDSHRPTLHDSGGWLSSEAARNRSLMVDVSTRLLFPVMMVLSTYFFFAGHNAPGGGFAGGLVAALALALRYLAGGREELEQTFPVDPSRVLGIGALLTAAAVIWPVFIGDPPLTSYTWDLHIPGIGDIHVVSALLFDAGVYLIVIGLVLHILTSLGGQLDLDEELRKQRARERVKKLKARVGKEN
ncbi:Na(+)/H(+) antiporter subunit A [Corynebacterium pseudotuberculosis]|nr:Na(+)/H(+) antiporter subunit A [Corynebacterium pseudotuberculosis]